MGNTVANELCFSLEMWQKAKIQTVMQDLQLHFNYVTIYSSTYGKRNLKSILQLYFKVVRKIIS